MTTCVTAGAIASNWVAEPEHVLDRASLRNTLVSMIRIGAKAAHLIGFAAGR